MKPIRILSITTILIMLFGTVVFAATTGTFTANAPKTITASATDTQGKEEGSEQYYLTVNKDSGVNTATASQWVNKGSSVNVTATAKSGYKITGGTGSTGTMNAAKTVKVTSALDAYILTWSGALSQYGSYLGTTTSGSSSNLGNKVIVYTNTSGVTSYADPYKKGSITIKAGTAVILRMVSGNYGGRVRWVVGSSNISSGDKGNYCIVNSDYIPIASGTLSISYDGNGPGGCFWDVKFS